VEVKRVEYVELELEEFETAEAPLYIDWTVVVAAAKAAGEAAVAAINWALSLVN
jgi:hypothetical protein